MVSPGYGGDVSKDKLSISSEQEALGLVLEGPREKAQSPWKAEIA